MVFAEWYSMAIVVRWLLVFSLLCPSISLGHCRCSNCPTHQAQIVTSEDATENEEENQTSPKSQPCCCCKTGINNESDKECVAEDSSDTSTDPARVKKTEPTVALLNDEACSECGEDSSDCNCNKTIILNLEASPPTTLTQVVSVSNFDLNPLPIDTFTTQPCPTSSWVHSLCLLSPASPDLLAQLCRYTI